MMKGRKQVGMGKERALKGGEQPFITSVLSIEKSDGIFVSSPSYSLHLTMLSIHFRLLNK